MTAVYTFDVFTSLDGFGAASANWSGYWGKQGPELLDHRLAQYGPEQRRSSGPTYRAFVRLLASTRTARGAEPLGHMARTLPTTVVSTTLEDPPRLAERDGGERGRRRRRRSAQGGVRGAAALARQPVDEPRADGRRPRRPRAGDALPGDHRPDRSDRIFEGVTSSCSRAARSTTTSASSSTDPLCIDRWTVRPTPSPPGTKVHSSHPRRRADRLLCSRSTRGTLTHFGHDRRCCQQEPSSPSNRGGSLLDGSRWAAR